MGVLWSKVVVVSTPPAFLSQKCAARYCMTFVLRLSFVLRVQLLRHQLDSGHGASVNFEVSNASECSSMPKRAEATSHVQGAMLIMLHSVVPLPMCGSLSIPGGLSILGGVEK